MATESPALHRLKRFFAWAAVERGWSSQELIAEGLGLHQTTVSALIRGAARPKLDTAHLIEEATADWPEGPIRMSEWARPARASA